MRRSVLAGALAAALLSLVSTSLIGGYFAGNAEALEAPRASLEGLLERVGLVPGVRAPVVAPAEVEELFRPFWEAWNYIGKEFYDENSVSQEKLFRGALKGLVGAVGDPYTLYMDPEHRELSEAELRGTFDGIGIQVEMTDQQLRIISPISGSPGERAGLRPADVITHVDGQAIRGMQLGEAIRLIRGPRGSPVSLTIQRSGGNSFDVPIVRDQIRVEAVRGDVRSDGVAYIKISSFSTGVSAQMRRTLDRLAEGHPVGWVLDLRGNPGGTLDGAISVASQFLPEGVVLYEQRRDGELHEIRRRGDSRATNGPMAVLIDKGSASASEIVAAALRDNGRATLVGEQTFGKGLVQVVHRLSDGSALRLTIARWLTPNQELIQGVGLAPQILVAANEGDVDQPLAQAVAHVRSQSAAAQASPPTGSAGPAPVSAAGGRGASAPADAEAVALLDSADRGDAGSIALA